MFWPPRSFYNVSSTRCINLHHPLPTALTHKSYGDRRWVFLFCCGCRLLWGHLLRRRLWRSALNGRRLCCWSFSLSKREPRSLYWNGCVLIFDTVCDGYINAEMPIDSCKKDLTQNISKPENGGWTYMIFPTRKAAGSPSHAHTVRSGPISPN